MCVWYYFFYSYDYYAESVVIAELFDIVLGAVVGELHVITRVLGITVV